MGQDWWRIPHSVESGGDEPIGKDVPETAGKMSGRTKSEREKIDTGPEGALGILVHLRRLLYDVKIVKNIAKLLAFFSIKTV